MRERRGAFGRASEIAGSVVAGVKRRQASRTPKVMLYDDDGRPRTLEPSAPATESLVDTARKMVDLVAPDDAADDPLVEDE